MGDNNEQNNSSSNNNSSNNNNSNNNNNNSNDNIIAEFAEQLKKLKEINDNLKEKNIQLIQQQELSDNKIEAYKRELELKNEQINNLDNRLQNIEEELNESKLLNDELINWKETHKVTDEEYIRAIKIKDDNIGALSIQLEHSMNKNAMLSESLKEVSEKGGIFERDDTFNISSASKQLLDYQKMLSYHKIKAIEEKYTTIKNINLGLQKAIQELALENEKYKYTIETIIKNSK